MKMETVRKAKEPESSVFLIKGSEFQSCSEIKFKDPRDILVVGKADKHGEIVSMHIKVEIQSHGNLTGFCLVDTRVSSKNLNKVTLLNNVIKTAKSLANCGIVFDKNRLDYSLGVKVAHEHINYWGIATASLHYRV